MAKKNDIQFTNTTLSMDRMWEKKEAVRGTEAKAKVPSTPKDIFPSQRFRRIGARVSQRPGGFVVDFSRVIVASKIDDHFIKRILYGVDENDLVNIPDDSAWGVKSIGPRRYYIFLKNAVA